MTLQAALTWSTNKLKQNNIPSASLDAEILLSFVLKKPKEFLYTHPEKKLALLQQLKFKRLMDRRCHNEPIAYLMHHKEFYGYDFYVNKHVLIPRPLTEGIIDKVLQLIENKFLIRDTCYVICDVGTGSGNIIISLAKELQKIDALDNFKLYGTDISGKALKVAQKNAKLHQVDKYIKFIKSDLLKSIKDKEIDIILANLPYLDNDDLKEPSIKKEPSKALLGDLYPKLFQQINELSHRPIVIFEDRDEVKIK